MHHGYTNNAKLTNIFRIIERNWPLVFLLALYIALAILGVPNRADQINSDGVAYLRLAQYLAAGNFWDSVSAYWSPLFSWLVAALMTFGVSALSAARLVLAFAGLALTVACWLLSGRLRMTLPFRFLACLIIALASLAWSTQVVSSDLLLAGVLTFYFYALLSPQLFSSLKLALAAGILAGIGFLAKSYTLPFFFFHFPLTLWLRAHGSKSDLISVPFKKIVAAFLAGLITFLVIAGSWIAVESAKYGKLTVSSAGKINHSILGPHNALSDHQPHPFLIGLWEPKADQLTVWEDPTGLPYKQWSPLQSRIAFNHWLTVIERNFVAVISLLRYDYLRLSQLALVILLVASFWKSSQALKFRFILLTVAIYLAGYVLLLSSKDPRYFWVVLPLLILSVFKLAELSMHFVWARGSIFRKIAAVGLPIVIFLSFAYQGVSDVRYLIWFTKPQHFYENIASALPSQSNYRVASNRWHQGLYLSYFLSGSANFLGVTKSISSPGIFTELKNNQVNTFVVWMDERLKTEFLQNPEWRLVLDVKKTAKTPSVIVFLRN